MVATSELVCAHCHATQRPVRKGPWHQLWCPHFCSWKDVEMNAPVSKRETSDDSARTGGYYGVCDPRDDVSADQKLDDAIARYVEIFHRQATCAAMNPLTTVRLKRLHGVTILNRCWIPVDTFYVGDSEKGIAL